MPMLKCVDLYVSPPMYLHGEERVNFTFFTIVHPVLVTCVCTLTRCSKYGKVLILLRFVFTYLILCCIISAGDKTPIIPSISLVDVPVL